MKQSKQVTESLINGGTDLRLLYGLSRSLLGSRSGLCGRSRLLSRSSVLGSLLSSGSGSSLKAAISFRL